ncbi:MAG: hypothetical protein COU33_03560 [Candidatus Magasanikbacteria bacterium CG10_big_fil_rev_8_21_14_0_10_43_6]|uniref:Uncharacterized protein n=1 Tax=Candidatus Magasanikbacteria bacterium CG10_big_fil_rev_8_21_14_0_10_43_6 TaxID=1974650 RepID=A0A2M6W0Q6_9BACT|nr:MAG: hypothetical protein COU33_03560 [Candidatus Magasanikbacteria bacterium CG10_big_fil_rev_8_21_14_0_10_43_6]
MGINNLRPILPGSQSNSGAMGSVQGWNHAQSTSISELQQKKDRREATSSINRVISKSSNDAPSTSITHPGGQGQQGVSSINSAMSGEAKRSVYDKEGVGADDADERRYSYMQRIIRARRAQMRHDVKKGLAGKATSGSGFSVKTGSALKKTGTGGLHKQLGSMFKKYRTTFKNLSKEDKKYFEDLVVKHAGAKTRGSGFGYKERRTMREEIEQAKRSGKISRADSEDFKGLIDKLHE